MRKNPKEREHAVPRIDLCRPRPKLRKNLIDCVYLYREFTSEAIRILLPVTTFAGSERKLHSFVAALQLGLKRQFSGSIDHLHVTTCEEPIADSSYSKKYLMLYDTVPGGTGYLKQLMRSEAPLLEVFEYALAALRACSCNQDPNKDGCYRCLFAYRSSYNMPETSRETAVEVLSDILQYREELIKTTTLRNVPVNALFDSELEARFIEALRRTGPDEDVPVSLSKELVNGKPGYFFKIAERAYYIEPQVALGTAEGVPVSCKADFVFRPARAQDETLPIAVFTDGYRYHQDRVGHDMAQRMAIVSSGRFHVWSLTWKDVENRYRSQGDYFQNYLNPHTAPNGKNFSQLLDGYQLGAFRDVHNKDSFTWFLRFLQRPEAKSWCQYAFVHGLLKLDPGRFNSPAPIQEWTSQADEILPDDISTLLNEIGEPRLYGWSEPRDRTELVTLRLGVVVEAAAVQPPIDPTHMLVAACLEDRQVSRQGAEFEAVWTGYLRLYNLFQYLPSAIFVSREGLTAGAYTALRLKPAPVPEISAAAPTDEWEAVRSVTHPDIHELLAQLESQACPVPDVGYELVDAAGAIVATAELGWPTLQIAFLADEEGEYEPLFTSAEWRTFPLAELQTDGEAVAAVFTSPGGAAALS